VLEGSEIPAGDVAIAAVDRDQLRPGLSLENMERRLLKMTLDATGGNRSRAAEMLGVSLRTVRNKIHGFGLPPKQSYRSANVEQDFDKNAGEKLCP